MPTRSRFSRTCSVLTLAGAVLALAACAGTTDHKERYPGYSGKNWEQDYGILEGRCNREQVGAVLGGLVGGVIGSQVGEGDERRVAIAIGAIAGSFIGSRIGRDMDESDRACLGHALELAGDQRRVTWTGADGRTTYRLTPVSGFERNGTSCREFDLRVTSGGREQTSREQACPAGDGRWRIVSR